MNTKFIIFTISLIIMGTSSSFALEKNQPMQSNKKKSIQVMELQKAFSNQGCGSNEPMASFGDLIGGPGDETAIPGTSGGTERTDCCYMETITFSPDATGTGQSETFNHCICPAGCESGCED